MTSVMSLKEEIKGILDDLSHDRLDSAYSRIDALSANLRALRNLVHATGELLSGENSYLGGQLKNVENMLDMADIGMEKLAKPAIRQLQDYPLDDLRVGEGINTGLLGKYIDFAKSILPEANALLELADKTDLSLIDRDGKITEYLSLASSLMADYAEIEPYLDLIKEILGTDENKLYLIAVQNSTEIRASGGFPGSMGTIRIQDGILTMGDFQTVYDVLATNTPKAGNITKLENKLFHNGLEAPRDADYCPDFERVAEIWALGYEAKQKEPVDGVISMTPCIVQRLLQVLDQELVLFDGTVINKDNATRVLQYDLYYKYFGDEKIKNNADTADELFADAAKQMMQHLMGNLDLSRMTDYLSVAEESFADRTLMLWMKDEVLQNLIAEQGWHGGLNTDPQNPQAGVYYSCTIPSKMGWFLVMNTDIGGRIRNEDGSYTYPVTVTFSNAITQKEINEASNYITGGKDGAIIGSAYFFAPAGGSVSDFVSSNGSTVRTEEYHNLELGYLLNFKIRPGKTVTVTYNVTTAADVETMLVFSKTPTVQDYHEVTE